MRKLLLLVPLALASLTGCKTACRQLSEKQCDCALTSAERTNCLTLASTKEANVVLTAADETTCEALIPKCDCRLLDTAEGKANCGLARPLVSADGGT